MAEGTVRVLFWDYCLIKIGTMLQPPRNKFMADGTLRIWFCELLLSKDEGMEEDINKKITQLNLLNDVKRWHQLRAVCTLFLRLESRNSYTSIDFSASVACSITLSLEQDQFAKDRYKKSNEPKLWEKKIKESNRLDN